MASSVTQNTGIAALLNAQNNKAPPAETTTSIFGEDGFTFGDIIDIVNPLQHIPIISNIYRKITGDTIAPAMEIAGGALFGGPLGAVASLVTTAYQSYIQDNKDSANPNSPYGENETTALAINTSQQFPNAISNSDYSVTGPLKEVANTTASVKSMSGWTLNSEFINREIPDKETINNQVSLNTIRNKHHYQAGDGIVNLAHRNTDEYTNTISSRNSPGKTIDVVLGSNTNPG